MNETKHVLNTSGYNPAFAAIVNRNLLKILDYIDMYNLTYSHIPEYSIKGIPKKELHNILKTLGEVVTPEEDHNIIAAISNDPDNKFLLLAEISQKENNKNETNLDVYCTGLSLNLQIICNYTDLENIKNKIKELFKKYIKNFSTGANITWGIETPDGLHYYDVHNKLTEELHNEAYPYINTTIDNYVDNYLNSKAPILVFMGKPGMGKTRFLRYILQKISERIKKDATVLYTMEEKVFSNDGFFLYFLREKFDAMVLEDIDLNLRPRKDGNTMMHKLLGGADGLIRNPNQKIILTTNLTNIKELDEALTREGRCFDIIETRYLKNEEAQALLNKLDPENKIKLEESSYTVAQIYNIINNKGTK